LSSERENKKKQKTQQNFSSREADRNYEGNEEKT